MYWRAMCKKTNLNCLVHIDKNVLFTYWLKALSHYWCVCVCDVFGTNWSGHTQAGIKLPINCSVRDTGQWSIHLEERSTRHLLHVSSNTLYVLLEHSLNCKGMADFKSSALQRSAAITRRPGWFLGKYLTVPHSRTFSWITSIEFCFYSNGFDVRILTALGCEL